MQTLLLYALALCAQRTQREDNATNVQVSVDVKFSCEVLLAPSSDDAVRKGRALAFEKWPEAEGWTDHAVDYIGMDKGYIQEMLEKMSTIPEDEDDAEQVM